jgi:hypothetical protein
MATMPTSGPSGAQKIYYLTILLPLWRGQLDQLGDAEREYRDHLLAVECLRVAKGPGADPLRIAEFCRTWQLPMTLPVIGPTAILRKIGKIAGGWPSQAAVFDPTGSINLGIKVMAQIAPLIGRIQMQNALLVAFDDSVVPKTDQSDVGSILESCPTPQMLMTRFQAAKNKVEQVWKDTVDLANKMEPVRQELGLPESTL